MSRYREQVAEAVGAVEILGPLRYAWLGVRSRVVPAAVRRELSPDEQRAALLRFVAQQLYWSFYCRGRAVPPRWLAPEAVSADPRLALAIAETDVSRGGRQPGWTLERIEDGIAVVTANGMRARAPLDICGAEHGALEPGAAVTLPAGAPAISPGYRSVVGRAGYDAGAVIRVYWHVTYGGATALVRALTAKLNAERVPFRLKVADHPSRFDRCDAAVLYLGHAAFCGLRTWLASLASESASLMRPTVPAFTLPLAPGVGLAEDAGGDSFGQRRCALLAEGILAGHDRGSARVDTAIAHFARAGLDIDQPYLEPALAGRHVF